MYKLSCVDSYYLIRPYVLKSEQTISSVWLRGLRNPKFKMIYLYDILAIKVKAASAQIFITNFLLLDARTRVFVANGMGFDISLILIARMALASFRLILANF